MAEPNTTNQNTTKPAVTPTAATTPDASVNQPKADGAASKSPKRSLAYIGNGVWTDAKGEKWSREGEGGITTKTFTEEEIEKRPDIKFMIEYGAIRSTEV